MKHWRLDFECPSRPLMPTLYALTALWQGVARLADKLIEWRARG